MENDPLTSVGKLIRQVVADAPQELDPSVIAGLVLDLIPVEQYRDYLLLLLSGVVRDFLRTDGNAARNAFLGTRRGGVTRSPKFAEARSLWQRMKDSAVNVDGKFKRLGSCTRDDLVWCVKERNEQIGMIQNQIQHFEQLIAWLDQYNVTTVDDLPEQQVA